MVITWYHMIKHWNLLKSACMQHCALNYRTVIRSYHLEAFDRASIMWQWVLQYVSLLPSLGTCWCFQCSRCCWCSCCEPYSRPGERNPRNSSVRLSWTNRPDLVKKRMKSYHRTYDFKKNLPVHTEEDRCSPLKRWLSMCSKIAAKLINSSEVSSMGSAVYFSRRVFTENLDLTQTERGRNKG